MNYWLKKKSEEQLKLQIIAQNPMVLGVMLHLVIDQVVDLVETGGLDNWFSQFQLRLNEEQKRWYLGINVALILLFGFML